ncbi:crossover junction endonuclease EME1 [Planococcus citri]|uniref:crossover junction endonuclease EME1 n=1 Tax=Planococcus citri TaxID=170843 RepID=UPI0031F97345
MDLSSTESEPETELEDDLDDLLLLDSYQSSCSTASSINTTSPTKAKKPRKVNDTEEKLKLKEEKLKLKEEKQRALLEKARLREEKKKDAEALKRSKPGECIKYITILLDSNIINCEFSAELLMALRTAEIQYKVEDQDISNSALWIRKLEDDSEKTETHMLILWTCSEFLDLLKLDRLDSTIQRHQNSYPEYQITIVIFGIEEYFRFQKTLKNRQLKSKITEERVSAKNTKKETQFTPPFYDLAAVEKSMIKLQLLFNLQYRFVETSQDLGLFVAQFTKSLAEKPFKLERCKKQETIDWFASADSKESVRVDVSGNGLLALWQQQICQFPNVGLDVSQSIVAEYPSPQMLIEAYDKCANRKQAELLLQDIPIRRSHGPLTSCRRIGPELSKKVFLFFNNLDGTIALSQD